MFNSIRNRLGAGMSDELDEVQDVEDTESMEDIDPDTVLNDPSSSLEMKRMAIQMIKDRYLKPQEE